MKLKKITIFLIFSTLLLSLLIKFFFINQANNTYDITEKQKCLDKKGQWATYGEGWFCNNHYEDGGKVCKNGDECLSEKCLAKEYSKDKTGTCSRYFITPGCFDLLSGEGKHTGFTCNNDFSRAETR